MGKKIVYGHSQINSCENNKMECADISTISMLSTADHSEVHPKYYSNFIVTFPH